MKLASPKIGKVVCPEVFRRRQLQVERKLKRMKKGLLAIASLALLLVSTSANSTKAIDSRVGYLAPVFSISNNDTTVSLQEMKGKYVLLTFWSSADAESRISNIHYNRMAGKNSKVQHLAVNFDRSAKVFNEVTLIDNLERGTQFHITHDNQSSIQKEYRIGSKGLRTLLINPDGEIVSENPSDAELAQLN